MHNMRLGVQEIHGLQEAVELLLEPVDVEGADLGADADGEAGPEDVGHEAQVGVAAAVDAEVVEERRDVLRARVVRVQAGDVQEKVELA